MPILLLFKLFRDHSSTMKFPALLIALALSSTAFAQHPGDPGPAPTPDAAPPTIFPHADSTRYLIGGQANIIFQAHAPFHSPYQGTYSFLPRGEYKTSMIGTIYAGFELNPHPRYATDLILDVEVAAGRGDSEALGIAGFTNLDVVRNPTLGSTPYLARYEIHQVIGLTDKTVDTGRTSFSLQPSLPAQRLELWVGRMSLPDLLDQNQVGTDSHLQFMNWSIDNTGSWDYAANTRGYTDAAVVEYTDRDFTARYAFAAMPRVANGIDLDYNFARANGQNWEVETRRGPGTRHNRFGLKGTYRIEGFLNHANMGNYRQQNILYLQGKTATPDITAHPLQTTTKYGVSANFDQEISKNTRLWGEFGWNDGHNESYAYTEVDQTLAIGGDYVMARFHRPNDKFGITFVTNAIKRDHQWYLGHGGVGFILGDGKLNYAREDILESYYNYHLWKGVYYALDEQFIAHPGYNKDRGPVMVEAIRMHVDF
jgi:high affinity Mn2+ porin